MKQALLRNTREIVMQDVDQPTLESKDVLIRMAYTGVCGSDLHSFGGTHPFRHAPVVLGHEISGTVAAVGAAVMSVQVGDAVTVMPYVHCGTCRYCKADRSNICENKVVPGQAWAGTFGDYFISPAAITYNLGDRTSLRRGVLAEPLAVGVHSARRARLTSDSNALVLGGGTIGLLTGAAARLAGARSVAVTDLYEHNLMVARGLGFEHAYNAHTPDLVERIREDYPEGFEAIFLTSGAAVTFAQAIALAQRGARLIVSAFFTREVTLSYLPVTIHELELLGSQIYDGSDFDTALDYLDAYRLPFETVITHAFPLAEAQAAFELFRSGDCGKILFVG